MALMDLIKEENHWWDNKFKSLKDALNYLNIHERGLKWCSAYDFAVSRGCKKVDGIWIESSVD